MVSKKGQISKDGKGAMTLPLSQKFAYGVGHVFNDLCASMWFTYVLIYFSKVLQFSSSLAGSVVLVGQIADGLATPFVGYFSDRGDNFWFCKYGRRKTWHLLGTVCVACTLPFIYSPCIGCEDSDDWAQMIYYSAFIIIFQFGWAAVQISHLSLVPELTPDENERCSLLAIRNSFTIIATMVVYVILWGVFQVGGDPNAPITPADTAKFQIVAYSVLGLGLVSSTIFHIGTKEEGQESLIPREELNDSSVDIFQSTSPFSLFKKFSLYQVAIVYMGTRLVANISQSIFPLYLHDDLNLGGQSVAILPLVMYAASFVMSTLIKPLNKHFGRKVAFCFGGVLCIAVSVWVELARGETYVMYLIYIVAGIYGIVSSTLLVTSLSITADFIGQDLNNGAFIYGVMSFTDKLSNGAVIQAIQTWVCFPSCYMHYRDSLVYVCGISAIIGCVAVLTLSPTLTQSSVPTTKVENKTEESTNSAQHVAA